MMDLYVLRFNIATAKYFQFLYLRQSSKCPLRCVCNAQTPVCSGEHSLKMEPFKPSLLIAYNARIGVPASIPFGKST